MNKGGRVVLTMLAIFLLCESAGLYAKSAAKSKAAFVTPSENKDRRGEYVVKTDNPHVNYFVCVPDTYSDDNPAGIHIHFHGTGGDWQSAPKFVRWKASFLERFNLIGINMQFCPEAGNVNQVALIRAAIDQVMADYKVVTGRGAITSFSAGGLPHGAYVQTYGRNERGPDWPFNHSAAYSANYHNQPKTSALTSWIVTVGRDEWFFSGAPIGNTQSKIYSQLLNESRKDCQDLLFKTMPGKGHGISGEEIAASAEVFRRSDLILAPFVYEPYFRDKGLAAAAGMANRLRLGPALAAAEKLLKRPTVGNPLTGRTIGTGAPADANMDREAAPADNENPRQAAALRLKSLIEKRMDGALEVARELAEKDPALCAYYGPFLLTQFAKTPCEKELKEILAGAQKKKEAKTAQQARKLFIDNFSGFFRTDGSGRNVTAVIVPEKIPILEQIRQLAGEQSQLGSMAAEFLAGGPERAKKADAE